MRCCDDVAALTKFWLSLLDRYENIPEVRRGLEVETPFVEALHSFAKVLQEQCELRGRLHDAIRHGIHLCFKCCGLMHFFREFDNLHERIHNRLPLNAGFLDLKDYEHQKSLWNSVCTELESTIAELEDKGGRVADDIRFFREIQRRILNETQELFQCRADRFLRMAPSPMSCDSATI